MSWEQIFSFDVNVFEIFVRGTVVYLAVFLTLRFVLRREAGTLTIPDLLMMLLVADASQNAMAANYRSVSSGLVLVGTIIFWNFALDYLGHKFDFINRIIHPSPLCLIKNGRVLHVNLKKEFLTVDDLKSELRQHGIEDFREVKIAYLESNGRVSVVRKKRSSVPTEQPPDDARAGERLR